MEYLMTYGWAILIIAVVLAVLFQLGVFGSSNFIGTSCLANVGFTCANPILNTTGYLSVEIGQAGVNFLNVTGIACVNSTAAPASFQQLALSIPASESVPVIFQCPVSGSSLGTPFTGYLWLKYNSSTQNGLESQIAAVSVQSSTVAGVGQVPVTFSFASSLLIYNLMTGSLSAQSGLSYYICEVAVTGETGSPSTANKISGAGPGFTSDSSGSYPFAIAGHQTTDTCTFNMGSNTAIANSIFPGSPAMAIGVIGTNDKHAPSVYPLYAGSTSYTVSQTGSTVIIVLADGAYDTSGYITGLPVSCTYKITPTYGYVFVEAFECPNQAAANYPLTVGVGSSGPGYGDQVAVAYVFPP